MTICFGKMLYLTALIKTIKVKCDNENPIGNGKKTLQRQQEQWAEV